MDLKDFATQVLSTCDEDAFSARGLVFRVNPGKPTLLVDALLTIDHRASAAIREQLKGRHDFLSFASKTDWAPEVGAQMRPAWLVVIVGRRIDLQGLPWFDDSYEKARACWWRGPAPLSRRWSFLTIASVRT